MAVFAARWPTHDIALLEDFATRAHQKSGRRWWPKHDMALWEIVVSDCGSSGVMLMVMAVVMEAVLAAVGNSW